MDNIKRRKRLIWLNLILMIIFALFLCLELYSDYYIEKNKIFYDADFSYITFFMTKTLPLISFCITFSFFLVNMYLLNKEVKELKKHD
jgi:hypothetical protein